MNSVRYTIGIDEAGRGPLAGPVAVGAFVFLDHAVERKFKNFRDSKQLSEEARERWYEKILEESKKGTVAFRVSYGTHEMIDKKGLTFAIKSAMAESLNFLKKLSLKPDQCKIILDGGLRAPAEYAIQETIIKGDEKRKVIALASIVAKVERDRLMKKYARLYADYGFEVHKGYATKMHYMRIAKCGLCPLHRRSFVKKLLLF